MKKILYILMLLPIFITGCSKDSSNKNNKIDSYEGYIIQGKMKNVTASDGGIAQPFVMVFMADNKAKLVNLNGETTLNYSVQDGKLVLDDNGYFNIANKQITDWVIAGLNITQATLKPKPATNQLRGKKFGGTLVFPKKPGTPIAFKIDFDTNDDKWSNPNVAGVFEYSLYGNIAGYSYDIPSQTTMFFITDNDKLEFAYNTPNIGTAIALLNTR